MVGVPVRDQPQPLSINLKGILALASFLADWLCWTGSYQPTLRYLCGLKTNREKIKCALRGCAHRFEPTWDHLSLPNFSVVVFASSKRWSVCGCWGWEGGLEVSVSVSQWVIILYLLAPPTGHVTFPCKLMMNTVNCFWRNRLSLAPATSGFRERERWNSLATFVLSSSNLKVSNSNYKRTTG